MRVALCSSMAFAKDMLRIKNELELLGHQVAMQEDVESHASGEIGEEDKWRKLQIDPFKTYFEVIKGCDAILVVNQTKKGVEHYIGGNTLIEMAFAYVLDKKIFLLNSAPVMSYSDEIEAMKPVVISGDLHRIL